MQPTTITTVSLHGTIVGQIWMPCTECTKPVSIGEDDFRYSDGSRPTIRDFALRATNDGDFQSSRLTADSVFVFERAQTGTVTRTRIIPVSQFNSITDCVDTRESWDMEASEGEE